MSAHGVHHVTGIVAQTARNLDFYTRVLGLRLVKRTVSREDPGSYHLYYGDELGRPGTIVSFFLWPGAVPGRSGKGEAERLCLRAPPMALEWWASRLRREGRPVELAVSAFDEPILRFHDPDQVPIGIVGCAEEAEPGWSGGGVPPCLALRGLHGVTLSVQDAGRAATILSDVLGFREVGRDGPFRKLVAHGGHGGRILLHGVGRSSRGRLGRGTISHVAFRAVDAGEQDTMVERLRRDHRVVVSEPKDRTYYRSVYFREPGGCLFEIATDGPGFTIDEPAAALGRALLLPAQLEERRAEIEAMLPALP